mgnify:CR=1 FL=1|tara:strand:- start:5950 stop:11394 length:5445 start_codon:yes stop_codon:yes gene_type:complete
MASEEQINNQSRFNDLQRDSKELLSEYQQGIRESSEFVSVLTTRSSQLVDVLKDTVSQKSKSSQADKDLISSITKINSLAKGFATPYTDAGKAIRDSNKALDLHSRLQKDVEVIGNQLGQDRLEQANAYKRAEEEIYNTQKKIDDERKNASGLALKTADELIEKDRNKIEAERQFEKFKGENAALNISAIDNKVAAEAAASQAVENSISEQKSAIADQIRAQEQLKAAKLTLSSLGDNASSAEKDAAQNQINAAKDELDLAKESSQIAKQKLDVNRSSLDQTQSSFKEAEREYLQKQSILKAAEKESRLAQDDAQFALDNAKARGDIEGQKVAQAALNLASGTQTLDTERDALELAEAKLDVDQQIYIEGQKSLGQSQAGVEYLKEETQRVREIVQAQTLWNGSLGAAKDILKKIGLDNQIISIGLDEGTKAAQEYSETLIKGRQEARGAAAKANVELEAAAASRTASLEAYQSLQASGSEEAIEAARKELVAREEVFEKSQIAAAEASKAAKESSSFINKFKDSVKVLGAGIGGTFKGMASELKALGALGILVAGFKKAFKLIGGSVVTGFISDLKGKFTEGVNYLKDQFFSLNSYIEDAKAGETFLQFMSQQTAEIATNLGIGTAESAKLITQAKGLSRELGMLPEELAKTTAELNIAFGTTQKFSDDTVKTMGQLTHQFGLTNDEASEFVKLSQLSGKETSDFTLETKTRVQALKEASNIAISEKAVMQEIAKSSAAIQLSSKGQGKNLADAAFHAKKLGLSLAQTEAIGGSLLDFESSIANEMEAELLIGRDLNLDKARQFALNNDIAGVAKEIAGQIGSAAEFGKMNVIQQEALAKSVGVSRDELAGMLKTQELLAGTGFSEMSDAQEQFKKLLKETGSEEAALAKMREGGASDALAEQLRVVSLQEKRAQQERDIVQAQASLAKNVNAMFTAFNKVNKQIKEIKKTVVDQMKPFFDQFAGLIGEGGDAFKNQVLPYAKQLGKFMNDVGLRLVDIVRNNGPAIKSIFSGVLDLFGSIYSVIGGVVKQLLGINNASAASSSFFESINDTIQSMVERLKNVDISALTEKIRGFIQGVKDTFTSVKEGVMKAIDLIQNSALGKFLSGNVGATSLAIAPIAFKGIKMGKDAFSGIKGLLGMKKGESQSNPLYVSDVSGGGGNDMMGNLMKAGGRKAGIGGGFKKGFKGLMDYAKMSVKGGRAGKVGRARLLRAGKGLITGQGASFVGGTGKGAQAAKAASKLGGIASKLGSLGKGLGKLAAGGGIGAIVGIAAEATLGHFQKKAEEAAASMEDGEAKDKKLRQARNLAIAGTTAKYAGLGATIGSVIPGVGTAVGAAVGALIGFTVGVVRAEKERKFQESAEGKFQAKYRKQLLKNAKLNQAIETNALKLKLRSERDSAIASLNVQKEFSEKLKGVDLNVPLDGVNENFQTLAQNMLDAGNITEEQFTAAINGTITPLDLMNAASQKAANNLTELYDVVGKAAQEQARAAETVVESQLGTNKAILEAEQKLIDSYASNAILLEQNSENLFKEFGKKLTVGIDTGAVAALKGTDSDVGTGFVDALSAMLEKETGQDQKAIQAALEGVATQLAKDGDFDLDSQEDILKLQQLVAERLNQGVDTQAKAVENAGLKAEKLGQEFGLKYTNSINEITKSQLEGSEELKGAISSLEGGTELLAKSMADGALNTSELDQLKAFLVAGGTALAAGGNDEALANLTKVFEGADTADDFILRPGQPALKFNKDDLVMGGTNLGESNENSSLSTEKLEKELQDLKQIMSGFVEQMSQVVNRPITVELNGNKVGQALGQDSYRIQ